MRHLTKYLAACFFVGIFSLYLSGCSSAPDFWKDAKPGQMKVLVSFPPLYSLTHAIGGENTFVRTLLTGTGPHGYQYSAQDALKLRGADLIVMNGLSLDDTFMTRLTASTRANQKIPVLAVGDVLPKELLLLTNEEGHDHDAKGHHHHGEYDPHLWLGPPQAVAMARKIAAKLCELDPTHAAGYQERCDRLVQEITQMHQDGLARFSQKKSRNLLTMHESMGYFAAAFKLNVVGSIQAQPGSGADTARIAQLENLCREKNVQAIAYEPQFSKEQPELLQKQLNRRGLSVQLVEFDPLETAPSGDWNDNPDPHYYLTKMRANIDNLVKALP